MNEVYGNPNYYEIAVSFRDIAAEVDVLEQIIQQYSRIQVTKVLEFGCGHAPHLAELVRRGYQYTGLDLSQAMLDYAKRKAAAAGVVSRLELGDMTDFALVDQADFAFVLLGSMQVQSTAELESHFDCVARALKQGGLYLLDACVSFSPGNERVESWEMTEGEVRVKTTWQTNLIDPVEQIVEESLTLEVEEGIEVSVFREAFVARQMYPQEFLLFVSARSDFEFVGWWNNWDLTQPLEGTQTISRPITLLRRV